MFLENFLFFSNFVFIYFCSIYIKILIFEDNFTKFKNDQKTITKALFNDRDKYEDQLDYIKKRQQVGDNNFRIFGWRVLIYLVAYISAFLILKNEPIVMFNIQLKWSIIVIIIIIVILFSYILKKLGVKY